ncbi:MAG: TonB family protein [Dysgonamonadaceae bacterium]|jgi:protein TonB|nr:TonB family protein [Dysgonamonadaceae bacterium]
MANKNIDLNSQEWRDMIFEGKNKQYGAYELRKGSSKRHIRALIIVVCAVVVIAFLPMLIQAVIPERTADEELGKTIMAKIDLEQPPEDLIVKQPEAPPPPELKASIKFTPPVIKKDEDVRDEDAMKTQQELTDTKITISVADVEGKTDGTGVDIADLKDNKVVVAEKEQVFTHVEQMPSFPGGDKAMMEFLGKNIKYPVIAQEQGIQGMVVLRFVVGKNGEVSDVTVLRSLDPSCDKEAIRVVKSMPRWIPGKQNGNPVLVYYTLPVRFTLQQ